MSIKTRLVFAFVMLLALIASQTIITLSEAGRLVSTSQRVTTVTLPRADQISHIDTDLVRLRGVELGLVASTDPEEVQELTQEANYILESLKAELSEYKAGLAGQDKERLFTGFQANYSLYVEIHQRFHSLIVAGDRDEASGVFAASRLLFEEIGNQVHSLRHLEYAEAEKAAREGALSLFRFRFLFAFAFIGVVLIEGGLAWYIVRSISSGLRSLVEGTRRVAAGDLSSPVVVDGQDEFSDLARSFNTMVSSLKSTIEENTRLNREALKMQEERIVLLRDHLSRIVRTQEQERMRVARELHDQAGQSLTALQFGLSRLERLADTEALKKELSGLRQLSVETMEEIRNLARDLRPSILDDLGLIPALREYVQSFSTRFNIPVDLSAPPQERRLPGEMETALFRIIQEGLTNIAKHSQATQARVSLRREGEELNIEVADNGKGFDVEKVTRDESQRSLGLFGINERVHLLGGRFKIESQPGQGTRLTATIPLPEDVLEPQLRRQDG